MIATGAVPLALAEDESAFGGKAAQLAVAAAAGLPVPAGIALSADLAGAVADGDPRALAAVHDAAAPLAPPFAVRSSAIGEDSEEASFAGQHVTRLGVLPDGLAGAIGEVCASAGSPSAMAYRRRVGLEQGCGTGVVVQQLVPAEVAGVLFTRDPLDGADQRVIEASWGLGQVVVDGRVIPDRFRLARGGAVLERVAGRKDVALELQADGEVAERPVPAERVEAHCLGDHGLAQLDALASECERVLGAGRDIEFAFAAGVLHLLQSRPLTR